MSNCQKQGFYLISNSSQTNYIMLCCIFLEDLMDIINIINANRMIFICATEKVHDKIFNS